MPHDDLLLIAPEVREALAARRPVVALESTIVTHGMPYPENIGMAEAVEGLVRAEGAVPATVAMLDGRLRVGLDAGSLERLATAPNVAKASVRDLAALLAAGRPAGTTVAATMRIAAMAEIGVFATGGIGGVHRGAETTFDISADLIELGRTPVAVVCAGAKSILDLPKTLEFLETQGVPVLGYATDGFPAFFARTSGLGLDHRFDTPADLARAIALHRRLGLDSGLLIVNPIPPESALDAAEIGARIDEAVRQAEAEGVRQKEVTPFLLARINALTGGRSLTANIALVRSNAILAARIAVALAEQPAD